jgi:hypothetical protein
MLFRYGFWVKEILTMYTVHSSPNMLQASASELPHCPAPVSVAMRLMPACLL